MSINVIQKPDGSAVVQNSDGSTEIVTIDKDGKFELSDVVSVAATGTNQATAAELTGTVNNVTAGDGTTAVKLPVTSAGSIIFVYHAVATVALPLFPGTSGTINGGSANASVDMEGKTLAICVNMDGTNWAVTFTANT